MNMFPSFYKVCRSYQFSRLFWKAEQPSGILIDRLYRDSATMTNSCTLSLKTERPWGKDVKNVDCLWQQIHKIGDFEFACLLHCVAFKSNLPFPTLWRAAFESMPTRRRPETEMTPTRTKAPVPSMGWKNASYAKLTKVTSNFVNRSRQ